MGAAGEAQSWGLAPMTAAVVCVCIVTAVLAVTGSMANEAAYRNGFWDGVLWDRERRNGGDYPSRPGDDWHGWEKLNAGQEWREKRERRIEDDD